MFERAMIAGFLALLACAPIRAGEPVGARPYEMVWANRTEDDHPALLDFENLDGWTVETTDSQAQFTRSRQEQLWGKYVGKLVYRGTGPRPAVIFKPPKPVPVPQPFDCVNFWVYGNNWAWAPDRTTPQVEIAVRFRARGGQVVRLSMGHVIWREWWVMHRKLSPDQQALLKDGAALEAIEIAGGKNAEDRLLFFDNLSCYREQSPPLKFEPRPERGITPFPGQTTGANTGPGKLPFPTRDDTILPDNLAGDFKNELEVSGDTFTWHYRGSDGHLTWRYKPATGTLGDVTAQWVGRGEPFRPLDGGGLVFARDDRGGHAPVDPPGKLVSCRASGDAVTAAWQFRCGRHTAEIAYTLRLRQKSLYVDVACRGGHVAEVRCGRAVGLAQPRLVTLPYLACDAQRPAVVVAGPQESPLFLSALVDHCRSNATALWAANQVAPEGVTCNGGSRYDAKTDGLRNDCFERLVVTVSPRFEEVLPNIPNPRSPWMHVAGERLWIAHGASDRKQDYALWKQVARYGMTKVVITDHETGWRDGGESFTLRTRAAPDRGGDEGQADYARKVRALGFRYGIYNNYTDFAPVNEHWSEDYVTRVSDGSWQPAWARCYNLKPSRAVELEARLAPIIQEKFHLDTAYCDVHTAVTPWSYCDRDARVPGAATFAATFYSYGEIMLHQKKTWNGPVYSEGNNHWYYCGLTDGNYGQDQAARLAENPWLVDFDLRKMHPLCCNFGMGNPGMFFGEHRGLGKTPEEREASLDRFLAATLAFGHTGFLVLDGGMPSAVRSYFNLQQVHAAYARETARDIRYADEKGSLLDTSAAVATGVFRRSQVRTEYSNGLVVTVNGHPTESWKTPLGELPPNGWHVEDPLGKKLVAWSMRIDGRRADYVDSPAYLYADGRGRFTRFPKAASNGQLVAHKRPDGSFEVIPVGPSAEFGISLEGKTGSAVALDEEGKPVGPATTRWSRGLVYITPVPKAFSYVLTPQAAPSVTLKCHRDRVIPGETATIRGTEEHAYRVPGDAKPGSLLWYQAEGAWIDFSVVPLVEAKLRIADGLRLELVPNVAESVHGQVLLAGESWPAPLKPDTPGVFAFTLKLDKEEVRKLPLVVTADGLRYERTWWLKAEESIVLAAALSEQFHGGQCLRQGKEKSFGDNTGAHAHWTEFSCGGASRRCVFMHPPYMTGVGYTFALFEPVDLPAEPKAAFRCLIGKGDGSDPGDGILFRAAVVEPGGKETVATEKRWGRHAWTPLEADLSPWAGKRVQVKLIADVGPADDSTGDWAAWADLRIESLRPALAASVHDAPVELQHEPGPHPPGKDIAEADLRQAKSGKLHFQAMGLDHSGPYVSRASLNDVPLGELPAAGGDEVRGVWADAELPLPPQAIASLGLGNRLAIDNPGSDSFAIRRFRVELELPGGRKCSSDVSSTALNQPPDWRYADPKGTGVPFGRRIETAIRFRLR